MKNIYPQLSDKAQQLIDRMKSLGYIIKVVSGYRSFGEQTKLYAIGRFGDKRKIVTHAMAGRSYHNYGLALDFCFVQGGVVSWSESNPWELLGREGKKLGLDWGGDFKKFTDRPHFELTYGTPLKSLELLMKNGGLEAVWRQIDKQGTLHANNILRSNKL